MEAFEHLCKVALEAEGFIVTSNLKFHVRRKTRKSVHDEYQEHGYEIDLIGARGDSLVLAEVKSFFGSAGVHSQGFRGLADEKKKTHYSLYKLFNDPDLRSAVCSKASERFGYRVDQLQLRMYVGKFAKHHEQRIRFYFFHLDPKIQVIGLDEIVGALRSVAACKTYTDDAVVMTVKALAEAGQLKPLPPR